MMRLPFNYILDESDPDIVTLHRQDGFFVAAFSARGATKEGILEAAMEDYRKSCSKLTQSPRLCKLTRNRASAYHR